MQYLTDRASYEMSVGPHGSGADYGSEHCLFQAFSRSQRMRYQHSNLHHWAWYSEMGIVAKEVDHILISTRWRILENCRVCRSAEFTSNTRLSIGQLRMFHLDRLGEENCVHSFATAIS